MENTDITYLTNNHLISDFARNALEMIMHCFFIMSFSNYSMLCNSVKLSLDYGRC